MNWNQWIRQAHRFVSVLFTVAFIIVIVASLQPEEPAEWVFLIPLLPLGLLLLTGLYLLVLPYATKWRGRRSAT